MSRPFHKLLIANRGEIACRVIRGAKAKGLATVAVYSDADADAEHVRLADEAVLIGPAPLAQSYLSIERILAAAKQSGADAIHPGYGFLSERPAFVEACVAAGLIFVGPSAEAMRVMGDKSRAKRRMIEAGVPCVPGYQGDDQSAERLAAEAARIGYPVMVKAAAGGGGRGMRLVTAEADFAGAVVSARTEAAKAFGDGTLLLERAVQEPRHVEIQVFGDMHGTVIHLGERDCSVQRRHQKVVEEAPSPAVDADLRRRMGQAAVRAAESVGYVGAGTVEFLLADDGAFYFLEMNTRLQVEHPVTELVTGLDLVALQLDVAAGKPLPLTQDQVTQTGHAIEVRLYAEDPSAGFVPQTGTVAVWAPASGAGIRIDHGVHAGSVVSPFYDPMIAKIIAWGADREEARMRLVAAVKGTALLGVTTNRDFLAAVLSVDEFIDGQATTGLIGRRFPEAGLNREAPPASVLAAAAGLLADGAGGGWSSSGWLRHRIDLADGDEVYTILLARVADGWDVSVDGEAIQLRLLAKAADRVRIQFGDGVASQARFARQDDRIDLDFRGQSWSFTDVTYRPPQTVAAGQDGVVRAAMSGLVSAVLVTPGSVVRRGDVVAIMEAMKMEHRLLAPADGIVTAVVVTPGTQISARDVILTVQPDEAPL
jgi:geranyl-CoA carboxylase alpha subunit